MVFRFLGKFGEDHVGLICRNDCMCGNGRGLLSVLPLQSANALMKWDCPGFRRDFGFTPRIPLLPFKEPQSWTERVLAGWKAGFYIGEKLRRCLTFLKVIDAIA